MFVFYLKKQQNYIPETVWVLGRVLVDGQLVTGKQSISHHSVCTFAYNYALEIFNTFSNATHLKLKQRIFKKKMSSFIVCLRSLRLINH